MLRLPRPHGLAAFLRPLALAAFAGYVLWNLFWLARGAIPPSILLYCTGLPCPTTGVCRSLLALRHGHYRLALLLNPLTMPYLALLAASALILLRQFVRRQRLLLPGFLAWCWTASLSLGWAAKFLLGRAYW